jgi:PAS domain S-box-containing protein
MPTEASPAGWIGFNGNWRLLDHLPVAVYVCARDGDIVKYNRLAVELWGREPDLSSPGERFYGPHKLFLPDGSNIPPPQSPMAEVLRTGVPVRGFEALVERPDGRRLTCLSNIDALRDADGEIAGAINCFHDISETRRAAEQTRAHQGQLQAIIAATPECIMVVARDGTLLEVNPAGLQMVEAQRPSDLHGANTYNLIVSEHRDQWRLNHQRVCNGEKLCWEFDIVGLAGTRRHVQTQAAPLQLANGSVAQLAVTRDMTEKKKYEETLKEGEARIRLILDSALDAVLGMDEQGLITEWNKQAEAMFGWRREEAIGRRLQEMLIPMRYWPNHEAGLRRFLATGEAPILNRTIEITSVRRNGSEFPVELSVVPYRIGKAWAFSGFVRDITGRKRTEASLQELQWELAYANRVAAMGQLSASIAHEIKQPLAAARINADTCIRWLRIKPPNLTKALETAARLTDDVIRANEIVDGVQSLFRKTETEHSWLNINDVINDVIELLRSEMHYRHVSIDVKLQSNLPPVFGDKIQLQQILVNLVMNGAEAMSDVSDRPRTMLVKSEAESTDALAVSVEDSGVGLDAAAADKIFEAFFSTKPSGTGMGLSICRSIVESYGGRIQALPRHPFGATFQFTLPCDSDFARRRDEVSRA